MGWPPKNPDLASTSQHGAVTSSHVDVTPLCASGSSREEVPRHQLLILILLC